MNKEFDKIRDYLKKETGYDVSEKNRNSRDCVYVKAVFSRIAKVCTYESFSSIGGYVNRHHATIMHHYYKVFKEVQMYEPKLYITYKNYVENYTFKRQDVTISTVDIQQEKIDYLTNQIAKKNRQIANYRKKNKEQLTA